MWATKRKLSLDSKNQNQLSSKNLSLASYMNRHIYWPLEKIIANLDNKGQKIIDKQKTQQFQRRNRKRTIQVVPIKNILSGPFSKSKRSYGSGVITLGIRTLILVHFTSDLGLSIQNQLGRQKRLRHPGVTLLAGRPLLGLLFQKLSAAFAVECLHTIPIEYYFDLTKIRAYNSTSQRYWLEQRRIKA